MEAQAALWLAISGQVFIKDRDLLYQEIAGKILEDKFLHPSCHRHSFVL